VVELPCAVVSPLVSVVLLVDAIPVVASELVDELDESLSAARHASVSQ
jgi:hypothetical protein